MQQQQQQQQQQMSFLEKKLNKLFLSLGDPAAEDLLHIYYNFKKKYEQNDETVALQTTIYMIKFYQIAFKLLGCVYKQTDMQEEDEQLLIKIIQKEQFLKLIQQEINENQKDLMIIQENLRKEQEQEQQQQQHQQEFLMPPNDDQEDEEQIFFVNQLFT